MKHITKITSLIVCLFGLYSCNSIKYATGTIPYESINVRHLMANNNVNGLVEEYNKSPQFRNEICKYLFGQVNYNDFSYNQLQKLRNAANCKDSILFRGFSDIIISREVSILKELERSKIKDVAAFYKQNKSSMPFLSSYIDTTIVANISNMSYPELKYCAHVFAGTEQGLSLDDAKRGYKDKHKKEIEKDLNAYFDKETGLLDYLEYALKMYVYTQAYKAYPSIMSDIFKGDMPEGMAACNELVDKAVSSHFSSKDVNDAAAKQLESMFDAINDSRQSILLSNLIDDNNPRFSHVSPQNIKLGNMSVKYDMSLIYAISDIDNETTLTGYAMKAAGFLGGIFSAAKFAYDLYDAKDKGEKEKPLIESFVRSYGNRIKIDCNAYVGNILKQAKKQLKDSQIKFKKEYYETY